MKLLNKYSVNLRRHDLEHMIEDGIIAEIIDGVYAARDSKQYNENVGLLTDNQWIEEICII